MTAEAAVTATRQPSTWQARAVALGLAAAVCHAIGLAVTNAHLASLGFFDLAQVHPRFILPGAMFVLVHVGCFTSATASLALVMWPVVVPHLAAPPSDALPGVGARPHPGPNPLLRLVAAVGSVSVPCAALALTMAWLAPQSVRQVLGGAVLLYVLATVLVGCVVYLVGILLPTTPPTVEETLWRAAMAVPAVLVTLLLLVADLRLYARTFGRALPPAVGGFRPQQARLVINGSVHLPPGPSGAAQAPVDGGVLDAEVLYQGTDLWVIKVPDGSVLGLRPNLVEGLFAPE